MICNEVIEINGKQYDHTYSDSGRRIYRDGVSYETAIDPLNSGRVYIESEEVIAVDELGIYKAALNELGVETEEVSDNAE